MKTSNIVFIHGWASGPYVWLYQASYFKDKHKVHAPSLFGYGPGFAARPFSGSLFDCMVKDISDFILKNKLDNVCLVGWSLGGMVSLKVAADLKDKINRLVLIGTTPKFAQSPDFQHAVSRDMIKKIHNRMKKDFNGTLDWFYKFCFSSNERSRNEFSHIIKILGDFIEPMDKGVLLAGLELLMELDVRHILDEIKIPSLLIHGGQDRVCLPAAVELLAGLMKNSRSCLIENAGHAPFLTQPEKVNSLIEDFIS